MVEQIERRLLMASISGQAFWDFNNNGSLDGGESTINGAVVYADLNGNGVLDSATEPNATTAGSGNYTLNSVPTGTITIRENPPSGFFSTSAPAVIVSSAGQAITGVNMANAATDYAGTAGADDYLLRRNAGGTAFEILVGGVVTYTVPLSISTLNFNLAAGNDLLTIDYASGVPIPAGGASYDGGADTGVAPQDRLVVNGTANPDTFSITAGHFINGGIIGYFNVESVALNTLGGNDNVSIQAAVSGSSLTVDAGANDDTISGDLDRIVGPTSIIGNAGADTLSIDNQNSPFADDYAITSTTVSLANLPGNGPVTYASLEGLTLNCTTTSNNITLSSTNASTPVTVNGGQGSDTMTISGAPSSAVTFNGGTVNSPQDTLNVNAGSYMFNADANVGTSALNLNVATGAAVTFNANQHLRSFALNGAGTLSSTAGGRVLVTKSLAINAPSGSLDLTNGAMIVDYSGALTPVAAIRTNLVNGYNGGAWNGTAGGSIRSSTAAAATNTALGFAEATDIFSTFPASFAGESVGNMSVLVRYTLYGDATLNKTVDSVDFNLLVANFGGANRRWGQGEFNYGTAVDTIDFNLLVTNFSKSISAPASLEALTGNSDPADVAEVLS